MKCSVDEENERLKSENVRLCGDNYRLTGEVNDLRLGNTEIQYGAASVNERLETENGRLRRCNKVISHNLKVSRACVDQFAKDGVDIDLKIFRLEADNKNLREENSHVSKWMDAAHEAEDKLACAEGRIGGLEAIISAGRRCSSCDVNPYYKNAAGSLRKQIEDANQRIKELEEETVELITENALIKQQCYARVDELEAENAFLREAIKELEEEMEKRNRDLRVMKEHKELGKQRDIIGDKNRELAVANKRIKGLEEGCERCVLYTNNETLESEYDELKKESKLHYDALRLACYANHCPASEPRKILDYIERARTQCNECGK